MFVYIRIAYVKYIWFFLSDCKVFTISTSSVWLTLLPLFLKNENTLDLMVVYSW